MRPGHRRSGPDAGRVARTVRRGPILAGTLLAAVLTACASGPGVPPPRAPAPAAPTASPAPGSPTGVVPLYGESVSFELDPATERALEAKRTDWKSQDPKKGGLPGHSDGSDTVVLPITGGALAGSAGALRGRVQTEGLAQFTHNGGKLELTDLTLDLDRRTVEATLDGRRVPLLDLDTSRARREDRPDALPEIVDVSGRISDDVRRELDERLDTDLPADSATVSIELQLRTSPV